MSSVTDQFYQWEALGRGAFPLASHAVSLEPPFRKFPGYRVRATPFDDGRRHTFLSRLFAQPERPREGEEDEDEIVLNLEERSPPAEFICYLPKEGVVDRDTFGQFLMSLDMINEPISMELVGTKEEIQLVWTCSETDARLFLPSFQSYAPKAMLEPSPDFLANLWTRGDSADGAVFQFTYLNPFFYQLSTCRQDLFAGISGVLSDLRESEIGVFQVLFAKAGPAWNDEILCVCFNKNGNPYPHLPRELTDAARAKAKEPLFAVTIRIAARSEDFERTIEVLRNFASVLAPLNEIGGNELTLVPVEGYNVEERQRDLLLRQTVRPGILMTRHELLQVVHLPGKDVNSPKWKRGYRKTRAAPEMGSVDDVSLGINIHRSDSRHVRLSADMRMRHLHVLGAPGSGKSTFLEYMIRQDLEDNRGLCVLDPHGELVSTVLGAIPEKRRADTILFDPADETHAVAFNILTAHSDQERTLLASDLVSIFARLSTSWGDQMTVVLRNAILAFLESSKGGTLIDLRRFLLDGKFRDRFLETVTDPEIIFFWREGFRTLTGGKSIGPIVTRLETFLALKPVRYVVAQPENTINFRQIMDEGKILLVRLSQGCIGEENAHLLGSLIVSKFGQAAMTRASLEARDRRDFFLYVDEFHAFMTPSIAEIITGARKYRLGLILAHQHLGQLKRSDEVAGAVRSSIATRVVFSVTQDAKEVASNFAHFGADDFQNLSTGEAIARVGRNDHDFNLNIPRPEPIDPGVARESTQVVTALTRERYARLRVEIEAEMRKAFEASKPRELTKVPKGLDVRETSAKSAQEKADEKDAMEPESETLPVEATPKPMAVPGRGGSEHKALQQRVKRIGERKGFRASIEKSVLEGMGSIDVALERNDLQVAVEITLTTSLAHETQNLRKCIEAGFDHVVLIIPHTKDKAKVEQVILEDINVREGVSVNFFTPEQFEEWLPKPLKETSASSPVSRGWKVIKHTAPLTEDQQRARDEEAMKKIAEALRTGENG